MKDFEEITARQLDRLVDGELSESERRDILLVADREPDSWRRLALAFVESQVLRHELSALLTPLPVNSPAETQRAGSEVWVARPELLRRAWERDTPFGDSGRATHRRSVLLRAGMLVACSLVAFGLGRWTSSADGQIARDLQPSKTSPRTFAREPNNANLIADSVDDAQRHQTLRVIFDDEFGGPPQAVEVPVLENSSVDPVEFLNSPPAISPEIQRALLRAGRRVHEQRQLYEVPLSDGRRGVMPVSNVLVENAGLDVFQ